MADSKCVGFEEKEKLVVDRLDSYRKLHLPVLDVQPFIDNGYNAGAIASTVGTSVARAENSINALQTVNAVIAGLELANKQEDKGRCATALKTLQVTGEVLPEARK